MSRLTGFLVASVALHATAVLFASASAHWIGGQTQTVLSVILDGDVTDGRAAAPRLPVPPQSRHATADEWTRARSSLAAMADAASPVDPAPDSGAGNQARAQVETRVRSDLARHFDYPWFARQRGWQGDVLLAFVVRPDGQLGEMRVERGSGFALLDQAALDSLRRVGRIPEAADWLGGREIAMHVPVLYRITGDR
jgi:periplasmic protein TonB